MQRLENERNIFDSDLCATVRARMSFAIVWVCLVFIWLTDAQGGPFIDKARSLSAMYIL